MQWAIEQTADHWYALSGDIDFETSPQVLAKVLALFGEHDAVSIDMSSVGAVNSACLALMLELIKQAQIQERSIAFRHVPSQILQVAKVCELKAIIDDFIVIEKMAS